MAEKNKGGRPKTQISIDNFKKLCGMQCTLDEIAGFFDCSPDTIENWCKATFKARFSDIYKKFSQHGKVSLRRNQFKLAEKNANMAIWLGKQYLGQKDNIDVTTSKMEDDALTVAIKESLDKLGNKDV